MFGYVLMLFIFFVVGIVGSFFLCFNVAMKNKQILKIRKKLDKLDDRFLSLIKYRTKLVDQVLANKRFKKDIIDYKRIKVVLSNISKKSKRKKIDQKITKKSS